MLAAMTRHTTFRFCLDPTVEQQEVLARHAGAARFAFNECLAMVKTVLTDCKTDPSVEVPWTGFDLINRSTGGRKPRTPAGCPSSAGDTGRPRTVTLGIGQIGMHDDTRRLRRMLGQGPGHDLVRHHQPPHRAVVAVAQWRGR